MKVGRALTFEGSIWSKRPALINSKDFVINPAKILGFLTTFTKGCYKHKQEKIINEVSRNVEFFPNWWEKEPTLRRSVVVGLSCGAFARQQAMKSLNSGENFSGFFREGDGDAGMRNMASIGLIPWKGGWPSAISIEVMPSDHTSAFWSYPSSKITSGAIQ